VNIVKIEEIGQSLLPITLFVVSMSGSFGAKRKIKANKNGWTGM
jgi:hypothetical protein